MFDATKLVVGREYKRRDGGIVRYLGFVDRKFVCDRYLWAELGEKYDEEQDGVYATDEDGSYHGGTSERDIISSDPLPERRVVKITEAIINVYPKDDGSFFVGGPHDNLLSADSGKQRTRAGILRLQGDHEIEVRP